jgi:hypothetical protein
MSIESSGESITQMRSGRYEQSSGRPRTTKSEAMKVNEMEGCIKGKGEVKKVRGFSKVWELYEPVVPQKSDNRIPCHSHNEVLALADAISAAIYNCILPVAQRSHELSCSIERTKYLVKGTMTTLDVGKVIEPTFHFAGA